MYVYIVYMNICPLVLELRLNEYVQLFVKN